MIAASLGSKTTHSHLPIGAFSFVEQYPFSHLDTLHVREFRMNPGQWGNGFMDKFGLVAPTCLVQASARFLFWPILVSQFVMSKFGFYQWYSEVHRGVNGGRVLLGALPWPESTRQTLLGSEHVSAVVNLVSEHQVRFPVEKRMDVPLADFVHPGEREVEPAVEFIEKCVQEGRTVYVHCRAGKGRSATVVACWLIAHRGHSPESAQTYLSRTRPQVLSTIGARKVVRDFYLRKCS